MFQYTYGGKNGTTFSLIEAKELVVVRTKTQAPVEEFALSGKARDLVPSLVPVAAFPEANVTVYRCVPTDDRTALSMRNAVRRTLAEVEGVRFAGRVLKEPVTGAIVVYTGNLYLQFRPDLPQAECKKIIEQHGLLLKEDLGITPRSFFVEAPDDTGSAIFALSQTLLARPEVERCHPELVRERKFKAAPNVHPMQWHLRDTDINGQFISQHAHVESAWELSTGQGITIAVLDDGVDTDHEELADKVVHPRDTVLNVDDAQPKHPAEQHGTACAGVACAAGKSKAAGVAPDALLLPIRLGSIGSIAEAKAFKWAADHGADVISCSWGPMDGSWWNANDPLHFSLSRLPDSAKAAIDYATEKGRDGKGCVITWAAGNGNEDVKFDEYASYPKVIAVAACNDQGKRAVYSDFGAAVLCCFPSNDFYMPNMNHPRPLTPGIWTTDRMGNRGYNAGGFNNEQLIGDLAGNYTARFGGTSSACPGVAGVVALMLSKNPDLTWQQVREILKNSCDRIDEAMGNYNAEGHSPFYGHGRVNARRAVENAIAAGPSTAGTEVNVGVGGIAVFHKTVAIQLADGEALGAFAKPERLLGLQLNVLPFHPKLGIHYAVAVRGVGVSEGRNGSFAGTDDRRRSVVGISISLTGELAAARRVEFAVMFSKAKKWTVAKGGEWAGSADFKKGKTIVALRLRIL